jgi:hypothetical protein
LDVEGFKDEVEAIDRLIRVALVRTPDNQRAALKVRIEEAVKSALKHCDPEPPKPRSCNRHDDCDAWEKAHPNANPFISHCHDDECEDCFGK